MGLFTLNENFVKHQAEWWDREDILEGRIAELEAALRDCSAGLAYIREHHGDLYGVGFERALGAANKALGDGSD